MNFFVFNIGTEKIKMCSGMERNHRILHGSAIGYLLNIVILALAIDITIIMISLYWEEEKMESVREWHVKRN